MQFARSSLQREHSPAKLCGEVKLLKLCKASSNPCFDAGNSLLPLRGSWGSHNRLGRFACILRLGHHRHSGCRKTSTTTASSAPTASSPSLAPAGRRWSRRRSQRLGDRFKSGLGRGSSLISLPLAGATALSTILCMASGRGSSSSEGGVSWDALFTRIIRWHRTESIGKTVEPCGELQSAEELEAYFLAGSRDVAIGLEHVAHDPAKVH